MTPDVTPEQRALMDEMLDGLRQERLKIDALLRDNPDNPHLQEEAKRLASWAALWSDPSRWYK